MSIKPPISATASLDSASVAAVKMAKANGDNEKLVEAAKRFEALFIERVLKSMREAKLADTPFDNEHSSLYQEMHDHALAGKIGAGSGLGLAALIVKQLGGKMSPTTALPLQPGTGGAALWRPQKMPHTELGKSSGAFVGGLWPHAVRAAKVLGADPVAITAQAALETGWGRHVPVMANGASSNNLFGIKAGRGWQGERVHVQTVEYEGGVAHRRIEAFRAYASVGEAVDDYVRLLQSNPRYASALEARSVHEYASALQEAGYATDPQYAAKISALAEGDVMTRARKALKISA